MTSGRSVRSGYRDAAVERQRRISSRMSRTKSKNSRSTEKRLRALLVRSGFRGWKMHERNILGSPDFAFAASKIAVFVDGCYWHGCSKCGKLQGKLSRYWINKIQKNIVRDKYVSETLERSGWFVVRIWEHDLRGTKRGLSMIEQAVVSRAQGKPMASTGIK